ncbi:putative Diguanylate cyclase [Candidatus Terasakiella magnetica]|uniref:Putative Diguanylate cyclase n=1 Tax=Candidatus Terasakiella magnetica TaxID=1867952 RepID=A0A1C3RKC7_9PROT|nr:GGDEF domain-containing protein [Candidatus Terasakiella magnetica]SCA57703.1 putative Diguanylate cyclase [Candidatus Terasakiella magnetica]
MYRQTDRRNEATLFNHMQSLRNLSRSPSVLCGDLYGAMGDIIHTLSATLENARIGIWVCDRDDPDLWQCLASTQSNTETFKRKELEDLIKRLDQDFIYAIDNASTLPRNEAKPVHFFTPHICAQLCASIQIDAQTLGIICCEYDDGPHRWALEEIYFTESIANFTSLFLIDYNRRVAEMKLFEAMRNDQLTGLANSSYFIQELKKKIALRPDCPLFLSLLDIRGFRHINDIHGHDVGDETLKNLALHLTRCFPDALIGRTASNEFILARYIENNEDMAKTSDQIIKLLKIDLPVGNDRLLLDVSIGAALYPQHGTRVKSLIRKCDIALFKAKETANASFVTFNEHLGQDYINHIRLKKKLKTALFDHRLINHYQPKVNLQNLEATTGEVLVRWQDQQGQFIPPAHFIPIAERTGMINELGRQVHNNICNDLCLVDAFSQSGHILSVNASVMELRNPNYVAQLLERMSQCHVKPHQLEIEVTESTFLDEDRITLENLKQLKKEGFALALDDFGTGYSSLSYLKQVHFDTIKIDRSFVTNIHQSKQNRDIATSLIKLFHDFDCQVVAEGIEFEAEADILRDLGCDFGQGFLYAAPMGIDEYAQYLDCSPISPKLSLGLFNSTQET